MLVLNGKEVLTMLEELVNPKHTALLLIDLQNDYITPGGYMDKLGGDSHVIARIIPQIKRVLDAARHCGILVVHVQMTLFPNYLADSPASLHMRLLLSRYESSDPSAELPSRCIEGTRGWQIVNELAPLTTEIIVKKQRTSAFMSTSLDTILRSNSIQTVTITGLATDGCVLATAIHAGFLDYYPVVLRDCVASGILDRHDAALAVMSNYIDVPYSEDILRIWHKSTQQARH